MLQTLAQGGQFADHPVEFLRFGREHLSVDARRSIRREHERDVIEREAGGAPQRDECQPFQHTRGEQTAQAASADCGDQPLFLIESQR
ncbi:hypothetical protein YTPLAS18_32110 [Nitrospira sp.]|nr:hypothetical protein YTPLAS18_32110 [Nitrospira sp.]